MPKTIDPDKPIFSIGAVADILGISPRMLRVYEEKGLILPRRTTTNRRQYSLKDMDILSYIQYLTSVKRVNIAGVLEIQKILLAMDEKQREAFMRDVEKEIDALPREKKKAYQAADEETIQKTVQDAEDDTAVRDSLKDLTVRRAPAPRRKKRS